MDTFRADLILLQEKKNITTNTWRQCEKMENWKVAHVLSQRDFRGLITLLNPKKVDTQIDMSGINWEAIQ